MPRDSGEASALLPSSRHRQPTHNYESGASTPRSGSPTSPTTVATNLAAAAERIAPATPPRSPKSRFGTWPRRDAPFGGPIPDRTPWNSSPSRSFLAPPQGKRPRRLSSASVLRSRALDLDAAHGDMTKGRFWALLAVCTLSIGSHYTQYSLGPLKSRLHRELGSTNSQFSLMISALNLNATWTPLVGGILVARFGTRLSSVVCTTFVLIGQIILYLGTLKHQIWAMTLGLWVFGLGMTPLMVVQETLLARLSPGGHLGLSLALGLVSGKSSSFIAALTSLPLASWGGDGAPFAVGLILCTLSWFFNILRLTFHWGENPNMPERAARIVKWDGLSRLGDVFWVFILFNVTCGMIWQPFLHLSANIIKIRYHLTDGKAALNASILLAGAIVLYPIIGWVTDHFSPETPRTTFKLLLISCILTLVCYFALSLPVSWVSSPTPALVSWAFGHGASPLLLVILVPRILPSSLVPLGLGIHKAVEVAASTATQTTAGLWLDYEQENRGKKWAVHSLLIIFAALNVVQIGQLLGLWKFEAVRRGQINRKRARLFEARRYERLPLSPNEEEPDDSSEEYDSDDTTTIQDVFLEDEPLALARHTNLPDPLPITIDDPQSGLARTDAERHRGKVAFSTSLGFIAFVWIEFIITAWRKL